MKYLKFTYVDALTGVSVAAEPALNRTKFPAVPGLAFVWARESAYPTDVPEFFGTAPDDSPIQVDGVLGTFLEVDYQTMWADEINARKPQSVTMAQARLALLGAGLLGQASAALAALPSPQKEAAQIEWEYRPTVNRNSALVQALTPALGLTETQLDELFAAAAKL